MATEEKIGWVRECATFEDGVRYWASLRDPLSFNAWQQGVSQLRALFINDPNLPPTGPDYTSVVSALWREVTHDTHGPEW